MTQESKENLDSRNSKIYRSSYLSSRAIWSSLLRTSEISLHSKVGLRIRKCLISCLVANILRIQKFRKSDVKIDSHTSRRQDALFTSHILCMLPSSTKKIFIEKITSTLGIFTAVFISLAILGCTCMLEAIKFEYKLE